MRVSLRWLQDYIDLPTEDPAEIGRAFDMLGHAVEETETFRADWTSVVIGKVLTVDGIPNADKVRVTTVDVGEAEPYQIICGAWNFDAGAIVPVALPGAVLPGDFKIGSRTIRGVESHGMICSARELGLGEEADGIMVLADDAPIGEPFETLLELPDVVFDLEVTNNRPDVMGMVGVARELAAWFDVDYRPPVIELATVPGEPDLAITITAPDGCNRFTAREVRGVTIGPSPLWMQDRLRKAGVRSISNIVDVTNYVMMETGHPLHSFDADRIEGGVLDVRWSTPGETLETLDGSTIELTPEDLVIVDEAGPTSLAAVMGGARSEVSDATTRVLMEAASWNPPTVMYTSRRHDMRSEASARFERGVDPNLAVMADDRACQLLVAIAGGEVLESQIDIVANAFSPISIDLAVRDVERFLGEGFDAQRCAGLLRRLDLEVSATDETLTVIVPTYRRDLTRPVDLIEEIARLADFDTFDSTVPTGPVGGLTPDQVRTRRLQTALRGMGLSQAINLPFVSPEELAAFGGGIGEVVSVRNPLRDDQSKLRQSLLPGLLRNVRDNLNRGARSVGLYEMARVFYARPWADDGRVPDQPNRLAVAIAGPFGPAVLGRAAAAADAEVALGIVSAIADRMGVEIGRTAAQPPGFHPTRTAELDLNGQAVGYAGEVHPDVVADYEIDGRVAVVEMELAPLVAPVAAPLMAPVSNYPHVEFDLSFDVPPALAGGDLVDATVKASILLERADVFDDFVHPESGQRSIAVRYRLRAPDRTLEREDIDGQRDAMVAAAAALGGTLRGES
ncbi:MAG: phenylalanine--tRNA ligase subunit beta [bacterium]|nr:phenylalanine--tRNA ligase subunit beta [bacterium]